MNMPTRAFLQHYKLSISTLSPVHIGCGEDYEPTNYVIRDGALHYFDLTSLIDLLEPEELKEIEKMAAGRNPYEPFQQFMHELRDRIIPASRHQVFIVKNLEQRYEQRIKGTINKDNKLELQRTSFNSHTQQPVLPGTSIKGAIRTAYLSQENDGRKHVFRKSERGDVQKGEGTKLEKELMQGQFSSDWFNLLKLSDANWTNDEHLASPMVLFDVNIPKKLDKMKSGLKSDGLCLMREVIPAMNHNAFSGSFTLSDIGKLIGVSVQVGNNDVKTPKEQLTANKIINCCNNFYLKIFSEELKTLKTLGCLDSQWENLTQELLNGELGALLKQGKAMLLRVGRHSGAEAVTMDGNRHIKIMLKDKSVTHLDHSTTLWLASEVHKQKSNLIPFGWVVAFVDSDINNFRISAIAEKMISYNKELVSRQNEVKISTDAARAHLQEELKKKQQEALAKKQRAEEAEQQHQAEQAALAAMSPTQRAIHTLRGRKDRGEDKGKGAGCQLAGDLRNLVLASTDVALEERATLHTLCLDLFAHLNMDKKTIKWKEQFKALEIK